MQRKRSRLENMFPVEHVHRAHDDRENYVLREDIDPHTSRQSIGKINTFLNNKCSVLTILFVAQLFYR